jgi:hypothetical protein
MLISRCCKKEVRPLTDYYVCEYCFRSCDTLNASMISRTSHDDTRYDVEVEAFAY